MTQSTINRAELLYIQLFRWAVILVLSVFLLGGIWFAAKGILSLPGPHKAADPPKPAPALVLPFNEWVAENKPKNAVAPPPSEKPSSPAKQTDDPAALRFTAQANALWPIVATYQNACKATDPLTKEQFIDSLQQTNLKRMLAARDNDYATSQVAFIKEALENPETIQLCLSGKSGIFLSLLEFHLQHYDSHAMNTKSFHEAERERILAFEAAEALERDRKYAEAQQILVLSAYSFGFFLSVMLLLIFARIEVNLRAISPPR